MAPRIVDGVSQLVALVGEDLGHSDWFTVSQERVDAFIASTDSGRWIHPDAPPADGDGRVAMPVVHGALTLSLGLALMREVIQLQGFWTGIHYGYDRVRFMSPVPIGSRLRLGVTLLAADRIVGGVELAFRLVFEVEDAVKPSCVADIVLREYE